MFVFKEMHKCNFAQKRHLEFMQQEGMLFNPPKYSPREPSLHPQQTPKKNSQQPQQSKIQATYKNIHTSPVSMALNKYDKGNNYESCKNYLKARERQPRASSDHFSLLLSLKDHFFILFFVIVIVIVIMHISNDRKNKIHAPSLSLMTTQNQHSHI